MSDVGGQVPAGWYDDGSGQKRWWDGFQWTHHYEPIPAVPQPMTVYLAQQQAGRTMNGMGVSYVRPQEGHSLMKHLLFGVFILWINVVYLSVSPNHYWRV